VQSQESTHFIRVGETNAHEGSFPTCRHHGSLFRSPTPEDDNATAACLSAAGRHRCFARTGISWSYESHRSRKPWRKSTAGPVAGPCSVERCPGFPESRASKSGMRRSRSSGRGVGEPTADRGAPQPSHGARRLHGQRENLVVRERRWRMVPPDREQERGVGVGKGGGAAVSPWWCVASWFPEAE
jgi:hypothetical protein